MIVFKKCNSKFARAVSVALLSLAGVNSMRASSPPPILENQAPDLWSNVYFIILLTVAAILFVCIVTLSAVIRNIAFTLKPARSNTAKVVLVLLGLFALDSGSLLAGNADPSFPAPVSTYGGLSAQVFYSMLAFIVFLGIVLIVQFGIIRKLLSQERPDLVLKKRIPSLSLRIFRYGIGFCLFFLFVACCYWERTTMREETEKNYQAQLKEAAGASYGVKNAITKLSVKYLNDTASLNEGRNLFLTNCASCHLPDGGGLVGPNLTDNYWLHGGSIGNIFNTITEGYPAKGMKSWKEDFTAAQIATLASYIKSLNGTKPAMPKDPEGVPEKSIRP
jgi:cytochrome c oxidase cbb3-type subunit 3